MKHSRSITITLALALGSLGTATAQPEKAAADAVLMKGVAALGGANMSYDMFPRRGDPARAAFIERLDTLSASAQALQPGPQRALLVESLNELAVKATFRSRSEEQPWLARKKDRLLRPKHALAATDLSGLSKPDRQALAQAWRLVYTFYWAPFQSRQLTEVRANTEIAKLNGLAGQASDALLGLLRRPALRPYFDTLVPFYDVKARWLNAQTIEPSFGRDVPLLDRIPMISPVDVAAIRWPEEKPAQVDPAECAKGSLVGELDR